MTSSNTDVEQQISESMTRTLPSPASEMMRRIDGLPGHGLGERHVRDLAIVPDPEHEWSHTLERLIDRCGSGFLLGLHGPRGTGKTLMAAHLMTHVKATGGVPKYMTTLGAIMEVRSCYAANKSELAVLNRLQAYDLLVLDEWQVRQETAFEACMLTHLIDLRYRNCKDTLLITNLKADEFAKALDDSIKSRMVQCGGMIHTNWGTFRTPAT